MDGKLNKYAYAYTMGFRDYSASRGINPDELIKVAGLKELWGVLKQPFLRKATAQTVKRPWTRKAIDKTLAAHFGQLPPGSGRKLLDEQILDALTFF